MNKGDTVVWVMGNSFSGSTMICLMLSGHPDVMGIGELHHLYRASPQNRELPPTPMRHGHRVMWCNKCKNFSYSAKDCSLARFVYGKPMIDWYDEIARFLDTNILVDSSKVELWWNPLIKRGVLDRYDVRPVILWKDPVRNIHSFYRKGCKGDLDRAINAFCRINNVLDIIEKNFKDVAVVNYKYLCSEPEENLRWACYDLSIPYKEGSSKFWNNTDHHCIGGNVGARSHIFDNYQQFKGQIHDIYMKKHQQVFEDNRFEKDFDTKMIKSIVTNSKVMNICYRVSELSDIDYEELAYT